MIAVATRSTKGLRWWWRLLTLWALFFQATTTATQLLPDGPSSFARGQQLFGERKYDQAAIELWKAVLFHGNTAPERQYDVQEVFQMFMQCYIIQGKMADGLAFAASESFRRGQIDMGRSFLHQALAVDPKNQAALAVQNEFGYGGDLGANHSPEDGRSEQNADLAGKTPEQLYEVASQHFSKKNYEECADIFEISCIRSGNRLGPSCANAVYCRNLIVDYGFNGTQFEQDMERIVNLTQSETALYRQGDNVNFAWKRAMSAHPHMMLGYPIDPMLKRYVAESVAFLDEQMARASKAKSDGSLPPLPNDMPFDMAAARERFIAEVANHPHHRIRVGFVGSGFNSKAVLFLSQDMFRFFDSSQFEIHVFSFGPADNSLFIKHGMRGVDWRERVKSNVDYFHDCLEMKLDDHVKAARYIHDQNIHILIEWDGYARQGERAQGLFALRPAPIQILHQEYLGTSGAKYVDYLFTDATTTLPDKEYLYTEKLIWMPNHFFSKGHAYQEEVKKPTHDYAPMKTPYELGTGSPQENRCLAPDNVGPTKVSFAFCNFNKLLKANPDTIRSWIRILREVPDSILCLMENPNVGIPYLRKFVHEAAGTSSNNSDPVTFAPGDGDELNRRIHFLPWEKNPFDHQMRNQDFCNVMLDSHPYNGHTVAQDALYGGVPIVTRSDGDDMSSRVTTSANTVLGLQALNAYDGPRQYEDIAIRIGTDASFYREARTKLIDSCLQRNPMHPYWDVARYVKNFEAGLKTAWELFLDGKQPQHIRIEESPLAAKGTFDDEILANPPARKTTRSGIVSDEL
jgi:protein O-GlcNAc transferase